jgi:hypothetical protein
MYPNLARIILLLLKGFEETFNFQKIIIWSFLEEKLRKSYPCMVIVMLHGTVRKMVLQLQVLLSKFWLDQSAGVQKNNQQCFFTAEAENVAMSHAVQAIRLEHLLKDLGFFQPETTQIYEDNQACIKIAKR